MIEYDYEKQFKEALDKLTDNNLKKKLVAIKKLVVERLNLENEFKKEKLRWLRMKWVGMDANLLYLSKHLPFRKKKRII